MKLRRGDKVQVLTGKDAGKQGTIMRSIPERDRVIVSGVNMAKRHTKPTRDVMQGGIIDKDMPIHVSNVALVCGKCGPTRVGYRFDGDKKIRTCRKCGGDV
ncbi:MAG: 50S ribosomal protein L24 [Acidimicrobiia bacterium]|jgi:large subunit ribosomal protein L24|nr:50S ribosomal protein L24 [Acidimicrobiia bacterium]MBP8181009.1 50S ribosomal protein L24 [Acidimicrobiia bacterium]